MTRSGTEGTVLTCARIVSPDSGAAHVAPIAIAPLSVARALVRRQTVAVGEVLP